MIRCKPQKLEKIQQYKSILDLETISEDSLATFHVEERDDPIDPD